MYKKIYSSNNEESFLKSCGSHSIFRSGQDNSGTLTYGNTIRVLKNQISQQDIIDFIEKINLKLKNEHCQ